MRTRAMKSISHPHILWDDVDVTEAISAERIRNVAGHRFVALPRTRVARLINDALMR